MGHQEGDSVLAQNLGPLSPPTQCSATSHPTVRQLPLLELVSLSAPHSPIWEAAGIAGKHKKPGLHARIQRHCCRELRAPDLALGPGEQGSCSKLLSSSKPREAAET